MTTIPSTPTETPVRDPDYTPFSPATPSTPDYVPDHPPYQPNPEKLNPERLCPSQKDRITRTIEDA